MHDDSGIKSEFFSNEKDHWIGKLEARKRKNIDRREDGWIKKKPQKRVGTDQIEVKREKEISEEEPRKNNNWTKISITVSIIKLDYVWSDSWWNNWVKTSSRTIIKKLITEK